MIAGMATDLRAPLISRGMERDSTVLSLSPDVSRLELREAALRADGYDVVSVASCAHARFEIEMGGCGIFLTCDYVPAAENRELIFLFRRNCSGGRVVLVIADDMASLGADHLDADVWVREADDPKGIIESLRPPSRVPKAS
jgi:hypothetical protein